MAHDRSHGHAPLPVSTAALPLAPLSHHAWPRRR
jgi:hypothetical protein